MHLHGCSLNARLTVYRRPILNHHYKDTIANCCIIQHFFNLIFSANCYYSGKYYDHGEGLSPRMCVTCTCDVSHFLAYLSRELIGYSWSVVRPSFVVVRCRPSSFTISKIFFSETVLPIKAKFYVEPPWVGGTIFCSRHLGHMTKMAATPIYGKNPSKIFSRTCWPIFTKLCMKHRGLQPIKVRSNDDPGVTLSYFTARSNLVT